MAIAGIGVDVVDIERFAATLARTPRLAQRLFAPVERDQPIESLAARFAAKEAVAKALGSPGGMRWHDCVIPPSGGHPPELLISGTVAQEAARHAISRWYISLSHDGGSAIAMILAEA